MKHYPSGSTSMSAQRMIPPEKKTINGQVHICFRDVVHNILVNSITQQQSGMNFIEFNEKIKHKASKSLSPKHKKRILKQAKKLGGI